MKKVTVPNELLEVAKKKIKAEETKRKQKLAKEKREIKARQKIIDERRAKGLNSAKKIFKWADEFSKTSEFKELIAAAHNYTRGFFFFDGHVEGCAWRGLGISKNGKVWWHKSGCGCEEMYVDSPEELSEDVATPILKAAVATLQNGEVWNCIKRRLVD
ncbi:MAG: hypothetical protein Q8Q23_02530 [bacterium]|nr:hypothetical protein [bacterium]